MRSVLAEALHFGVLFYLSGLVSLLAGMAIVNLHNLWQMDWPVIITVQFAIAVGSTICGGRASTIVAALVVDSP